MQRYAIAPTLLLVATAASAETATFDPIIVESTFEGSANQTPGAARSIDDEVLVERRPYSLHDALEQIPGLRTLDDDAMGRRSGIGVRGAPPRRSRKTLLLEDGVPINASPYLDSSGHYTPPTQRLERVDALKGAGHVIYGPINNYGIVNFRNKQPTETPVTTVELGSGNLNTSSRHVMHQRTDGAVGTVLSYTSFAGDGIFDIERTRYDDYFGSVDWALSEQHSVGLSATFARERSNYDESNLTPQEFAVAPYRKKNRFAQENNTIAPDYYKLDLTHQWQSEAWQISSRVYASRLFRPRFTVDPDEAEVSALPEVVLTDPEYRFVPGESGVMVSRTRDYRNLGAESRFVLDLGAQRLSWGVQLHRGIFDDKRSFGEPGEVLDANNRGNFRGENDLAAARLTKYQSSAVSAYVLDRINLGNWSITPGLRAERYEVKKDERFRGNDPGSGLERDEQTIVLPSLAVLYRGIENTQIFANVARGYTPAFARTADSFPLDPEIGINTQVGFRTVRPSGLYFDSAIFYSRIEDTVVQLPFTIDDDNLRVNAADSNSYGIDLGLGYETQPLWRGISGFADLGASYTRARFTDGLVDGNRVPGVSEHAGTLTLGLRAGDRWHASLTASHLGDYFSDLLNTNDFVLADEDREPVSQDDDIEIREVVVLGRVASRTVLSARSGFTTSLGGTDVEFWVAGRNLTDRLYVNDLENGIRPGPRRSVLFGLTAQLQ
ncbi:MAG: TonB-dependent receptor family protein [Algiphilus sp.]